MSRLILFTNDYPYRAGDVVFVEKEIEALAERFEDVVVFCHARDTTGGMVALPPGVRFGGNLFEPAPEDAPRKLIEVGPLALLLQATWRELWSGRLLRNLRLFAMGAKVGMTQAHRSAVREAIAGDRDTVAYAFWAMGGGLALPWLRGVSARVVRVHRYDLYEERAIGGYLPFRPFLFARADRVLAISDDAAQYLEERYPQVGGKVRVSRLGAYGPDQAPRRQRDAVQTIVSCSAVSEVKRVDRILDSVLALHALDPSRPVRWVHFGEGPLFPQLRESVLSLPPGIEVDLRGQVPNATVSAFYETGAADAFVNLSASEGVPVSIMEAIAFDIPVVATAVGGTPEIVGPELRTGELVDADAHPDVVATALAGVLDAPSGTYAPRERWEAEYDARRTGARAAELVSSLADGRGRRRGRA
ncbi:glycosyltransferase [uncultured Microbacterium sp.]|uniref:glycosyltransferase n=1 Tax=uncultured Microbacterium sp. TaxID=191216 RepID=UPI0028F14A45|nr:glycosyltransferase [uncultured Microbacterium sp.]